MIAPEAIITGRKKTARASILPGNFMLRIREKIKLKITMIGRELQKSLTDSIRK